MNTCFSLGKLMKQFGNPPLSKMTLPFQLTPLFLSNFFMTPLFIQISKTRNPPNFRGGGGNYELQHKILENERIRTSMYFSEHKLVVEIDEKGHIDRNQNKENKRQTKTEKHPDCKFFHRINPVVEGCYIFLEICKIQNYITQSNEGKQKKKQNNY